MSPTYNDDGGWILKLNSDTHSYPTQLHALGKKEQQGKKEQHEEEKEEEEEAFESDPSFSSSHATNNNTNGGVGGGGGGWTYSSSTLSDWSITSEILLTVTYCPTHQSVPEYTNINVVNDYLHRTFTCRTTDGQNKSKRINKNRRGKRCSRSPFSFGPKSIDWKKEVYTTRDVDHVEEVKNDNGDAVMIPDLKWKGVCLDEFRVLRVFLRSKVSRKERFSSKEGEDDGSKIRKVLERARGRKGRNQAEIKNMFCKSDDDDSSDEEGGIPPPPWKSSSNEKDVGANKCHGPIITFAIPIISSSKDDHPNNDILEDCPPLLWRVEFPPDPTISLQCFTIFDGNLNVRPYEEEDEAFVGDDEYYETPTHVFINGYQSWSYSGSIPKGLKQPKSAMMDFVSGAFNHGGKLPPRDAKLVRGSSLSDDFETDDGDDDDDDDDNDDDHFYQSDFFTCMTSNSTIEIQESSSSFQNLMLDEAGGPALILGWVSQRHQFGIINMNSELDRIGMHCSFDGGGVIDISNEDDGRGVLTDWAYAQIVSPHCYEEEPLGQYLDLVGYTNGAHPSERFVKDSSLMTGWCSWYHYYNKIRYITLFSNVESLSKLKRKKIDFNAVVIDDGYMTRWGDWSNLKTNFPTSVPSTNNTRQNPLKALSNTIKSHGMKPGLWLAPFACDKSSKLAKSHPDWILHNDLGRPSNSANCGKFFYGLDATNPEVRAFVHHAIRRAVQDWGFEVLKLDFLYAGCLAGNGRYDVTMSRAEAMDLALKTIRDAAGDDVFIIGCGCPVGSAVGYVDAMRVSADTGPTWYADFPFPKWDNGTLPSVRGMIRNTMTRGMLGHRWWHNDPDCLLVGNTTKLKEEEVVSAASVVAMSGGMLLLSDDLMALTKDRLDVVMKIFPVTGATAVGLDLHCTEGDKPMPVFLRLWCSDSSPTTPSQTSSPQTKTTTSRKNANQVAVETARLAALSNKQILLDPSQRLRSRVRVANGLGTWTLVSLSNWQDEPRVVSVPIAALLPPVTSFISTFQKFSATRQESYPIQNPDYPLGFHVFAFWSSKYIWIPSPSLSSSSEKRSLSKRLRAHETEIFHFKPVTSYNEPQYIGSDLHFTCGYEVDRFLVGGSRQYDGRRRSVEIWLKNEWERSGYIYVFLPNGRKRESDEEDDDDDITTSTGDGDIDATVNGESGWVEVVAKTPYHQPSASGYAGRVVRLFVTIQAKAGGESGATGKVLLTW